MFVELRELLRSGAIRRHLKSAQLSAHTRTDQIRPGCVYGKCIKL